jgi:hypothetical protein
MPGTAYNSSRTEAVAIFHDVQSFQATIDDLLLAGFDTVDSWSAVPEADGALAPGSPPEAAHDPVT